MLHKLFLVVFFCIVSLLGNANVKCFNTEPKKSKQFVYDYASMLRTDEQLRLENKLKTYNDSTGTQIAMILVDKVFCDMGLTAVNLGHEWGVGQEQEDNGVVYLVAKEDRKIYIATGYGVEGYVPDVYVYRIINNVIKPAFREYNYYEGLDESSDIIIELLEGTYTAPEDTEEEGIPLWLILIIILIILWIMSRRNKGKGNQIDYGRNGRWILDNDWGDSSGNWGDFKRGRGVFFPPSGGGGFGGGGFGGGFGGFGGGGFGGGGFGGGGAGGSW